MFFKSHNSSFVYIDLSSIESSHNARLFFLHIVKVTSTNGENLIEET